MSSSSDDSTEAPGAAEGATLDQEALDGLEAHEIRSAAPAASWTITMAMAVRNFTPLPGGGCVLHFTPAIQTPQGLGLMAPRVDIPFSPDAWEAFKREVQNDGRVSDIAVASSLPAGLVPPAGARR